MTGMSALAVALAVAVASSGAHAATPSRVHLSTGRDPATEFNVMWSTEDFADSVVRVGTASGKLDTAFSALSPAQQYSTTFIWNLTDVYTSEFLHTVPVVGLAADTTYYYTVGDGETESAESTYHTGPAVGTQPAAGPLSFAVVGDLGQTNDSALTVSRMMSEDSVSAILHAGDLAYADCEQPRWESYLDMIEPLSSTTAWMTCPGNHEIEVDGATNATFTAYEARFKMPAAAPAVQAPGGTFPEYFDCCPSAFRGVYDYGSAFYSFEYGLAHVVFLNSYTATDPGSAQYSWLSQDLARVNRTVTPWLFVLFHCPWYNSDADHQNEFQAVSMRKDMEPLLLHHGVNAVFSGHVHAYERSNPVAYNTTDFTSGIMYVTIGDGGNREGHADNFMSPAPEWSAFRNGTQFGHGRLTLINATVAEWEWRRDVDQAPLDGDATVIQNLFLAEDR